MDTHFQQNLLHAMCRRFGPGHRDKHLAAALKIDRSTASRLRRNPAWPAPDRLEALSRYFDVTIESWSQPPDEFAETFDRGRHAKAENQASRCVRMQAIAAHRHLWQPSFDIHRGQYVAYWKAHGIDECYVGSLVHVASLEADGIGFTMLNPYIRDDAEHDVRCWRYAGVAYPVADYLYFYGEQTGGTYELFTMILTASPLSPPDLLRGCMAGIHVRDGRKQVAVNAAVVLMHLDAPIADWTSEIGRRLGKLPAHRLPDRVRRLLAPYPGAIPVA